VTGQSTGGTATKDDAMRSAEARLDNLKARSVAGQRRVTTTHQRQLTIANFWPQILDRLEYRVCPKQTSGLPTGRWRSGGKVLGACERRIVESAALLRAATSPVGAGGPCRADP